ncbi:MAG: citramalate synthase, partial [bacterium]|nr:citramalate synthase [bacterium]
METIYLYDATLREGSQAEDVSFTVEDKVRITEKLDELGVNFIEGGWPSSNPTDKQYFKEMQSVKMNHATVVAFGSTARPGIAI